MLIPSPLEAKLYYTGLSPDWPVLVARTGATRWEPPTGPEGDQKLKELRTVGNHPIRGLERRLASQDHRLSALDEREVD